VLPHLDAAYNLARWLSAAEADDVTQEAMLRAFRGFDGFRGSDARPWLLAIVRNCHYTAAGRRARLRAVPLPEEETLAADVPDPEASAIEADEARKVNLAIEALPDEFREVLVLRELENMSYREIAAVTGAPMGTVMSRLARARTLLRQSWRLRVKESAR
jgi:RNA polymerase sigma factor (sigma-70 family)